MRPIKNNYGKYYTLSLTKSELSVLLACLRQSNDMMAAAKDSYWQDLLLLEADDLADKESAANIIKKHELREQYERVRGILDVSIPLFDGMKAFYDEPAPEAKK